MYISAPVAEKHERLTREQSQARTRERLLESAAAAFSTRGIEATTIERIAAGAGHTRGAFYAHFEDKHAICVAMLERQFDAFLERFDATLAGDRSPVEKARRAGDDLTHLLEADTRWQRLSFEFAAYALRNAEFRRRLAKRHERLRAGVTEVFRARAAEQGIESPLALERLTLMTFVISTGISNAMLLEPDRIPSGLQGEILAVLFRGLAAMSEDTR